jgi:hypothetical protein
VRSAVVVPPEVAGKRSASVLARGVGEAVGPLAQECLDQGLGFAVGLGAVGPGETAAEAVARADEPPGTRAIGARIVGEDALDNDALPAIPGERAGEEGRARPAVFAGQDLRIGQARVVVDRDVEEVPARAGAAPAAVLEDRLADVPEKVESLAVDWRSSPARSRS